MTREVMVFSTGGRPEQSSAGRRPSQVLVVRDRSATGHAGSVHLWPS
jgi:hypothetical protein